MQLNERKRAHIPLLDVLVYEPKAHSLVQLEPYGIRNLATKLIEGIGICRSAELDACSYPNVILLRQLQGQED